MRLAEGIDRPLTVCDIETLAEVFDIGCYDPDTGQWIEFEVSRRRNQLFDFVEFYLSGRYHYMVTFNGIDFDQVVLQYVVANYKNWYDLSGEEIARLVHRFVKRHLDDRKYGLPPRYKEHEFPVQPLDLFKINHFDNESKMTSLKWIEFMLCMPVEEMPIHHDQRGLSDNDIDLVRAYRRKDVLATLGLLYVTIGQPDRVMELNGGVAVDHLADYRGMNKLQDRFDVMDETGLLCLNWSDVKIGEEWNKLDYMKALGLDSDRDLFPKDVVYPYGKLFKRYFPKTMKFRTKKFRDFAKFVGEQMVLPQKQEFKLTHGQTTYTVAKGGIHSTEKNRFLIPPPGWKLRDADVGSQYPNSIVKLEIYGPHLQRIVLENYNGKIDLRITYKGKAKELKALNLTLEARKFESIQGLLKLCLNGGYYGKLGQKGSWLEFPEGLLRVCMGNQIEILMAIEMMEEEGFSVLSGNTDGFVTLFPEDKEDRYKALCAEWERAVGNDKMGKLEYVDYLGLWQRNINNYIGKYVDEKGNVKVKKKGSFVTTYGSPGCELNKNKSKRVIPLALEAYFIHGTDPETFIRGHRNIHDFTVGLKASGQMHYEEQWEADGRVHTKRHKKLVVVYVATDGTVLYKRGINNMGKPMNNHCFAADPSAPELGQPLVRYFNEPFGVDSFEEYRVNYDYYIYETLQVIDDIEKTKRARRFLESKRGVVQATLF